MQTYRKTARTMLIWEILDNGIDEHLAGFCSCIDIVLQKDGGVSVTDHGRGVLYSFKNRAVRVERHFGAGIVFRAFSDDRKQALHQLGCRMRKQASALRTCLCRGQKRRYRSRSCFHLHKQLSGTNQFLLQPHQCCGRRHTCDRF